jgi:hypothetical protein
VQATVSPRTAGLAGREELQATAVSPKRQFTYNSGHTFSALDAEEKRGIGR